MKVLHVCAPGRIGGLESVVAQLAKGLRARDVDAQVAVIGSTADPGAAAFATRLQRVNIPVHRVDVGGRQYLRERRAVRQLLRAGAFSVLHSHGYRADVVDGPVARSAGCAHVLTLHGFTGKGLRGHIYESLQIRRATRADAVVAVSAAIGARVRRARSDARVHLIRNAIGAPEREWSSTEAREQLGLSGEIPCVGWVGRLSFEKGPDIALEAIAQIPLPVRLVFIGDGPMRANLETRWQEQVRAGRVVFAGVHDSARSLMCAFDVLIITSRTEGTPITLLEAMWSRVPTVVSAVGGIPDVVDSSMSELVPVDAKEFAQAILRVLGTPAHSATKVEAAERRVREKHHEERWIDEHISLYQEVGRGAQATIWSNT